MPDALGTEPVANPTELSLGGADALVHHLVDVVIDVLPTSVCRAVGVDPVDVVSIECAAFGDGTGAASGDVQLITATLADSRAVRLVRKTFSRLRSGRHAEASRRPDHWASWRREPTAYRSGLVPTDGDLRAPRLFDVVGDALYLEYVGDQQPSSAQAAGGLGRWHHADRTADRAEDHPWLARNQLAQRLAVSDLDWSTVDLDPRLPEVWARRTSYLEELEKLPWSIAHGDFGIGNLRLHAGGLVVLDWATLGVSPVGFDLAHLALSTLDASVVEPYLEGLQGRDAASAVRYGYRAAVALIGTSRAHWMASHSIPIPPHYLDFVLVHAD